jgi:hypothetical protein
MNDGQAISSYDEQHGEGSPALIREDLRIDVTKAVHGASKVDVAATIVADRTFDGPRIVAFGYPGGGYTRVYFDLIHPDLGGEGGQATYHASRGWVFISCDQFGGGNSTPLPPEIAGLEDTARAMHVGVADTLDRLRAGTLVSQLDPIETSAVIGLGHSLGAMQLIVQQSRWTTFDALAILGFSAIHTVVPTSGGAIETPNVDPNLAAQPLAEAWAGPLVDDPANISWAHHMEDVPAALVEADTSVGFPIRVASVLPPWVSSTFPPFAAVAQYPGIVGIDASSVECPVMIGVGSRDVVPNFRAEATAYHRSTHVTLVQVPNSAHIHNFSGGRELFWRSIQLWGDAIPQLLLDKG